MTGVPPIFPPTSVPESAVPALLGALSGEWAAGLAFSVVIAAGAVLGAGWVLERRRRMEAEDSLRQREAELQRLGRLVNDSPDCFVVVDGERGRMMLVNQAAANLLGYSQTALLEMSPVDLCPEEQRSEIGARLQRRLQEGGTGTMELGLRHGSGGQVHVELRATCIRVAGASYLQIGLRDLEKLRQAMRELRESEARYAALFENVPVAVLEKDYGLVEDWLHQLRSKGVSDLMAHLRTRPIELVTLYGNVQILSANRGALKGMDLQEAAQGGCPLSPDEIPPHLLQLFQRELEALWEDRTQMSCSVEHVRSDGTLGHALLHWASPKADPVEGRRPALLVFTDLSEIRRAETALASEQLRSSKLDALGILAGGIAHDFNNLLTVVMGNLTLAMMDPATLASAGRWLRESEKGVLKARDLTQRLMTIAKGGDPVRSAVSLPDVVRENAEFALHGSKVRAEFKFEEALVPAEVDKTQIGQVVQNLVINAVQAMPEGGSLVLRLRNSLPPEALSAARGAFVKLSVEDTGAGIPKEHLAKIFDPYFTTKAQGSGLGLATLYSIVRKHGGHVEVESELGKGTCFDIWLPAAKSQPRREKVEFLRPQARTGRILFMDDEEPLRRLGQALLQSLGYDVKVVSDGSYVLAEYEAARRVGRPFDLVMLDLTVPGGLGAKETLAQLRQKDAGIRAVVMSGYASDPVCTDHAAHGFAGVVLKPYRVTDLAKGVQSALGGV